MKTIITGGNGQLGWELQRCVPKGTQVYPFNSSELDITDINAVETAVTNTQADVIVNAAAYTAVDKAEQEIDRAYAVNSKGAVNLAKVAKQKRIRIVHISTDFVFNGLSSSPYQPDDKRDPLGVYGASKLEGENRIREIIPENDLTILRTAWVYSSHGSNFVKTMLRLMGEKESLGVVADQIGTPTWAGGLADAVWQVIEKNIIGTHHWSDAGVASWYDFAVAIQEEACGLGLLAKPIPLKPISSSDYPTPAKRPAYSVLDKRSIWEQLDIVPIHWRESLKKMLKELKK